MKNSDIQPNSIEMWAQLADAEFSNHRKPLDDQQSNALITLIFSEKDMENEEIKEKLEKDKLGMASLFYKRVKYCHTYTVTNAVSLFIGGYIANSPGEAVMYSNYIQYKAFKANCKKVDIGFICTEIFPMGIPTEQALFILWDLQKVERKTGSFDSDNLLDYAKGQESITFK